MRLNENMFVLYVHIVRVYINNADVLRSDPLYIQHTSFRFVVSSF